jgi:hypothetical protein
MNLTKDQITKDALIKLRAGGARVRKVHNVPFSRFKSKGQIEKGWPDIQGYSCKGVVILCEVKTKDDVLSQEQTDRLRDCRDCGGFSYIATEKNGSTIIYDYNDHILSAHYEKIHAGKSE